MGRQISMMLKRYTDCYNPIASFVNKPGKDKSQVLNLRFKCTGESDTDTTNQTIDRGMFLLFWRLKQILYTILLSGLSHLPISLNALYALPFVVVSVLSTQEASGQDFLRPKGNMNAFTSKDTTIKAQEYNSLTTKKERDNTINVRIQEDWVKDIRARNQPTLWNCNQSMLQLLVNSHNWGKDTYYGGTLFYNGYDGNNLEQIYQNSGTTKDMGKLGLPIYYLSLYDEKTLPDGHAMNIIITEDTITNWNAWNIIEPQLGLSNLKPGSLPYFPKNCKHAEIYYNYLFKDKNHEKNFGQIKILEFEIKDGKATLTYNINNDTKLVYNADNLDNDPRLYVPLNERVHLFETRQDAITGIEEIIQKEILKIYPNPATNYITIETPNNNYDKIKTEIYTIEGKLLKTEQTETREKIDVSNLKEGMNLVRITAVNTIYNGKFVKK